MPLATGKGSFKTNMDTLMHEFKTQKKVGNIPTAGKSMKKKQQIAAAIAYSKERKKT